MNIFIVLVLVILGFLLGITIGFIFSNYLKRNDEPIGDLRIDESDPEDGPYLFLELKTKPDNFKSYKRVTLNVKAENYLSQK